MTIQLDGGFRSVAGGVRRLSVRAALVWCLAVLAGCADAGAPVSRTPQVDTLSDGSVVATSSATLPWSPEGSGRWRVAEALRIGSVDGGGPDQFGNVRSVAVDDLGRMWVVDEIAREVRVFGPDGVFVRSVGGPGEGPAEFQRIGNAFYGPGGRIWVEDLILRRWEVFDTSGARVAGHRVASSHANAPRSWTRQGLLAALGEGASEYESVIALYEPAEDALRATGWAVTLPEPRYPDPVVIERDDGRGGSEVEPPFAAVPAMFMGHDLWLAQQGDDAGSDAQYEVQRIALGEDRPKLAIRRFYAPAEIPDSVRTAALESFQEMYVTPGRSGGNIGLGMIPTHYPPFDGIHASADGHLWVKRTLAGGAGGFDVFDPDGRLLGQPEIVGGLPPSVQVQAITDRSIYAIVTDDDLGVDYVVRLDVAK